MKLNFFNLFLLICLTFILTGCGHSIVRTDRGTGVHLRIPNPGQQGDSLVELKLGNIDTTMAVIRGNASFDSTSAKGAALSGSGGISERFALSTNPQLNEGYVAEVLTSPNASDETKKEVVKYLYTSKAPTVSDAKSVTIGAAAGSGSNASSIEPETTGLDKIVKETSNTIIQTAPVVTKSTENIVQEISENTAETIQHTANVAGETTKEIGTSLSNNILISIIIAFIIIVGAIVIEIIIKKKKQKKEEQDKIDEEELAE